MSSLPPHYIELVQDAILKIYWFKSSFRDFLRRSGVSESLLATFAGDETKRTFLGRILALLEQTEAGISVINRMTDTILEQNTFLDLQKVENSKDRIKEAKHSQNALRSYVQNQSDKAADKRSREQSQKAAKAVQEAAKKRNHTLQSLSDRLTALLPQLGTIQGGFAFETWFHDLIDFFELPNHRPYRAPDGRQIDGSVTVDGTTYLLELKFTKEPSDVGVIDSFRAKLLGKADNTMGIIISMSGFDDGCKKSASGDRTPFLLFDSQHIYMLLTGVTDLRYLIDRTRRYSSQTGECYLAPGDFGR
jgi:hypothetical protein